jgi:type IV pilus assembly protein PilB
VLHYLPVDKAREFNVIPVERQEMSGTMHLVVAMTDPTNLLAIDTLQFVTGCRIRPALASAESINQAIDRNYGMSPVIVQEPLDISVEEMLAPPRPSVQASKAEPTIPLQVFLRLQESHETLIRLLFERGVLHARDLDELV